MAIENPLKETDSFRHISEYETYKDFKRDLLTFLHKTRLDSLSKFDFCSQNDYVPSWQSKQIRAINQVFNELYGQNKVKWGFNSANEDNKPDHSLGFYGAYIVINGKPFPLDFESTRTLHELIIRRKGK